MLWGGIPLREPMTGLAALFQALQGQRQQMAPDPRMQSVPPDWYSLPGLFAPDRMAQGPMPFRGPEMQAGPAPPADTRALSALFEGKR